MPVSNDPDDHYPDSPSDFRGGENIPERCVECREWWPCTTALADQSDAAARVKLRQFWQKECRCPAEWGVSASEVSACPLHEPCDDQCAARRDPGDDVPELKRALRHERSHHLMGGCSHAN